MPFSRRRARFPMYHRSRFVCNSSVVLKMMESCNVRDVLGSIWLSENLSIPLVRMHLEKSKMVILLALPEGLVGKWLSSIKQILNPSRPTAVQRLIAQNRIIQFFWPISGGIIRDWKSGSIFKATGIKFLSVSIYNALHFLDLNCCFEYFGRSEVKYWDDVDCRAADVNPSRLISRTHLFIRMERCIFQIQAGQSVYYLVGRLDSDWPGTKNFPETYESSDFNQHRIVRSNFNQRRVVIFPSFVFNG